MTTDLNLRLLEGGGTGKNDPAGQKFTAQLAVCWQREKTVEIIIDSAWLTQLSNRDVLDQLNLLSAGCRARAERLETRIAARLANMHLRPVVFEPPELQIIPKVFGEVVHLAADRLTVMAHQYEGYAKQAKRVKDPSAAAVCFVNRLGALDAASRLRELVPQ
jgi:hypothetical protein